MYRKYIKRRSRVSTLKCMSRDQTVYKQRKPSRVHNKPASNAIPIVLSLSFLPFRCLPRSFALSLSPALFRFLPRFFALSLAHSLIHLLSWDDTSAYLAAKIANGHYTKRDDDDINNNDDVS